MIELKCKMCGGNLKIIDKVSYATCEYCGSTMTLPRMNDDKIVNLFNRANHYRLQNEFDKAMATYENILAEDNTDAEAHWGVVLAKYGIEYIEDPKTHNRIPTCHRVQYDSIFADLDYKEALKNAQDNNAKALYEKEASQIAEIQKNILTVARNEKPYDIFICYKETDNKGERTKDSVFAQDIYEQLVEENYKVFFSRITLEDKLGTEYEPYIFSALNSAKVMLVIGTTKENFEAVWVKNEWSRFLELLRKDKNRVIIPCYRDMNAYDLPEELSLFQAQDMNKIGFMQDLTHGISKIIDKKQKEQISNNVVIDDTNKKRMKFENNLLYARKCVDEQNWENVEKYYTLLQAEFPEDIIIESTIFIALSKAMRKDSEDNYNNLYKSFNSIEKYYDTNENKEEALNKFIDCLFKITFPTGEDGTFNYKPKISYTMTIFNNKLEQLAKNHNEIYIHKLISKHRQIIDIVNNKVNIIYSRDNKFNRKVESQLPKNSKSAVIFAFISFLIMAIIATGLYLYFASLGFTDDVPFSIVVVLPWLCVIITGIIWYSREKTIKSDNEKNENSKKVGTTINKILYIWLSIVAVIFIIGLTSSRDVKGAFTFILLWGIVPFLIIKGVIKLLKKLHS